MWENDRKQPPTKVNKHFEELPPPPTPPPTYQDSTSGTSSTTFPLPQPQGSRPHHIHDRVSREDHLHQGPSTLASEDSNCPPRSSSLLQRSQSVPTPGGNAAPIPPRTMHDAPSPASPIPASMMRPRGRFPPQDPRSAPHTPLTSIPSAKNYPPIYVRVDLKAPGLLYKGFPLDFPRILAPFISLPEWETFIGIANHRVDAAPHTSAGTNAPMYLARIAAFTTSQNGARKQLVKAIGSLVELLDAWNVTFWKTRGLKAKYVEEPGMENPSAPSSRGKAPSRILMRYIAISNE